MYDYYIWHISKYPQKRHALYATQWCLSSEIPEGYDNNDTKTKIVDLAQKGLTLTSDTSEGLTPEELTSLVDSMLKKDPVGDVVKISYSQGQYLYKNHPTFKPKADIPT